MRRRRSHRQPCREHAAIKAHASPLTTCDVCHCWPVAFHWRATYPELVLCENCLELFSADIRASILRVHDRWQRLALPNG